MPDAESDEQQSSACQKPSAGVLGRVVLLQVRLEGGPVSARYSQ